MGRIFEVIKVHGQGVSDIFGVGERVGRGGEGWILVSLFQTPGQRGRGECGQNRHSPVVSFECP